MSCLRLRAETAAEVVKSTTLARPIASTSISDGLSCKSASVPSRLIITKMDNQGKWIFLDTLMDG